MYSQTESDSVQKALEKNSLEDLIQKNSKQQVIMTLSHYTLPDTIVINGGLRNIWYMETVGPDPSAMYRDIPVINNKYYASYRLKALYWIWLIYQGKENLCHKPARLVNTISKDTLFDYIRDGMITARVVQIEPQKKGPKKKSKVFRINPFYIHYQGRIVKDMKETIDEVEALYREWIEIVEKEGLQRVQQQQKPFLQNKYQWIVIE